MNIEKTYYLKEEGRYVFIVINIIISSTLFYFGIENFKEHLFFSLILFYLFYRGIRKLLILIIKNVPIVELYDTHLKFALYSGKYSNAYRSLFGNHKYVLIEYSDIKAIYKNKKLFNPSNPRTQGFIYLKGTIENNELEIPTFIRAIDGIEIINLKQRLDKKNVDVKEML
ncbi:hypothetical protein [Tenacibaculum ascidiaceicola]|uniref:hypothetical protein n=1 Tax=Tenacibaculum ascidiaceicola TaxID=1699411 RepID=UPI0038936071